LTLDDGVETVAGTDVCRIEIPEQSSGSELFFSLFEQQSKQNSNENETK
jgi:hypothetical protein